MALKPTYKTADDVPAEHKSLYKEDPSGGGFVLDVEGMEPRERLDEFRTNNRNLKHELDEEVRPKLKTFEDIGTLDEFKHLKSIKEQLDESKLIRSNKLDEAVDQRVTKLKAEHQTELQKREAREKALQDRLSTMMIDEAVIKEAVKLGAKQTALDDIVARARMVFKVEDGKLVGYGKDGKRDYGKNGDGLTTIEWLEGLAPNAPHLFEENRGAGGGAGGGGAQHQQQGGGQGGGGSGRYNGPNPWKKDPDTGLKNLSLIMKITKENPALAKRLKEEAGIRS